VAERKGVERGIRLVVLALVLVCTTAAGSELEFPAVFAERSVVVCETSGSPRGIALDPAARVAYVTDYDSDRLLVIDVDTGEIKAELTAGDGPADLALTPDARIAVVVNMRSDDVSVIDLASGKTVGRVTTGDSPRGVAVVRGNRAFVTNLLSNTVSVVDIAAANVVGTIRVESLPRAVSATSDGNIVCVTTRQPPQLVLIDTATSTVSGVVPVPTAPSAVAIARDDATAYVVSPESNKLTAVDLASAEAVRSIDIRGGPNDIAVSPSGGQLLVAKLWDSPVSVFDTKSLAEIQKVEVSPSPQSVAVAGSPLVLAVTDERKGTVAFLPPKEVRPERRTEDRIAASPTPQARAEDVRALAPGEAVLLEQPVFSVRGLPAGAAPRSVAIDPGRNMAYVANYGDDTVSAIDLVSGEMKADISVGDGPVSLALAPDESLLLVVNALSDNVSIVDIAAQDVVGVVPVGKSPSAVAISHDGTHAYVVSLFSDELSVVNVRSREVEARLDVPSLPEQLALSPDGTVLAVAAQFPSRVVLVDPSSMTVAAEVEVPENPVAVRFTPNGKLLLVACARADSIVVIDVATRETTETIRVEGSPSVLAVSADGRFALVGRADSPEVAVVNIQTFDVVRDIPMGAVAGAIAIPGDGSFVLLACPSANELYELAAPTEEQRAVVVAKKPDVEERQLPPAPTQEPVEGKEPEERKGLIGEIEALRTGEGPTRVEILRADRWEIKHPEKTEDGKEVGGLVRLEGSPVVIGRIDQETGRETRFSADEVEYQLDTDDAVATGDVRLETEDAYLSGSRAEFNFESETGVIENARGHEPPFYYNASRFDKTGAQEGAAQQGTLTTCDLEKPHQGISYKEAEFYEDRIVVHNATVFLGPVPIFYWPRYTHYLDSDLARIEIRAGHESHIGDYLRTGYRFRLPTTAANLEPGDETPDRVDGTIRLDLYSSRGPGGGVDGEFQLFKGTGQGDFVTYATRDDNGRTEIHYRQELPDDWVGRVQWEQWYDEDFLREFYYGEFKERTEPETFLNLTRTKPNHIISATARVRTHDWFRDTERLPELRFNALDQPLGSSPVYLSFEDALGYLNAEPSDRDAFRTFNRARLSLDTGTPQWLKIVPYAEVETSYYSEEWNGDTGGVRESYLGGITFSSRFHRDYKSFTESYSKMRHVVMPSVTYSYRDQYGLEPHKVAFFDALDRTEGRSRIQLKLDNMLLVKSQEGNTWPLVRWSLYGSQDFANDYRKQIDWETVLGIAPTREWALDFQADMHDGYTDFKRVNTSLHYRDPDDPAEREARFGFGYSQLDDGVFNRDIELLLATRVGKHNRISAEWRYDFVDDELEYQKYSFLRTLHCVDVSFALRDRRDSMDFLFEVCLTAFPTARLKL